MVRVNASRTSRGAHSHVRALWELMTLLIEECGDDPALAHKRMRIRTTRAALERAYPKTLGVTESDIAQLLAEEDGDSHEDLP